MVNPSDRGISVPSTRPTDKPVISERSYVVPQNTNNKSYSDLSNTVPTPKDSVREFFANSYSKVHDEGREFNGPSTSTVHDEGRTFNGPAESNPHNLNIEYKGPAESVPHDEQRDFKSQVESKPHDEQREFKGQAASEPHDERRDFRGPDVSKPHDERRDFKGQVEAKPHDEGREFKGQEMSTPHDEGREFNGPSESNPHNLNIEYKTNAPSNPNPMNRDYKSNAVSTPNPMNNEYKGPATAPNSYFEYGSDGKVKVRGNPTPKDAWFERDEEGRVKLRGNPTPKDAWFDRDEKGIVKLRGLDSSAFDRINPYKDKYASLEKQSESEIHKKATSPKYKVDGYKHVQLKETLEANNLFDRDSMPIYTKFNRLGFINPYSGLGITREYLFFTKPDLHIMNVGNSGTLNPELANNPFFADMLSRYPEVLTQLQSSAGTSVQRAQPFMTILSNHVKNSMDLPSIQGKDIETAANAYGTSITYRGSGYKSDENADISLEFEDTKYLEVYMLLRAYEEYLRVKENGDVTPPNIGVNNGTIDIYSDTGVSFNRYIKNKELHDRFSIWKIVVDEDFETILFWAKAIGCYFNTIPRDSFSDLREGGTLKFSVEIKAPFIRDMNPIDLYGLNQLVSSHRKNLVRNNKTIPIYTSYNKNKSGTGIMNNTWASVPYIQVVSRGDVQYKWLAPKNMGYLYKLRWL